MNDFSMFPFLESVFTEVFFWYIGEFIQLNDEFLVKLVSCKEIVTALIILEVVLVFANGCVDMRSVRYYIVPLYLINGALGTVTYWMISIVLSMVKKDFLGGYSTCFSRNSMTFFGLNMFWIAVFNHIFPWTKVLNMR